MKKIGQERDAFTKLVTAVSLTLSQAGYKKRGTAFWKDNGETHTLIEFQKSSKSSAGSVLFTLNLCIFLKALLDPEFDNIERDRSSSAHFRWRIGNFLSPKEDKWWVLSGESDEKTTVDEVNHLLIEVALPYLEQHSRPSELLAELNAGNGPPMSTKQKNDMIVDLKRLVAIG